MSAKALFIPTTDQGAGSYWDAVTERIAELPRDEQDAAIRVWMAILSFLPEARTDFVITDRMLRQSRWLRDYSLRFVQKGLHALQRIGLIDRERRRGRRKIVVLDRLRGREPRQATAGPAPAKSRPTMIPNVGAIPATTPEQLERARIIQARAEVLELTEEEQREADAVWARIRNRPGSPRAPRGDVGRPPDP